MWHLIAPNYIANIVIAHTKILISGNFIIVGIYCWYLHSNAIVNLRNLPRMEMFFLWISEEFNVTLVILLYHAPRSLSAEISSFQSEMFEKHFGDIWRYLEHLIILKWFPIHNTLLSSSNKLYYTRFDSAASLLFLMGLLESCKNWMCWLTMSAKYHYISHKLGRNFIILVWSATLLKFFGLFQYLWWVPSYNDRQTTYACFSSVAFFRILQ